MLEHTSVYYNVPQLCDEGETFPDLYTRLGPCDLQEPVWAKMSSALTAGVTKKRKKSDTKPQAQLNKCQNEKRRREQENIYIEELAELISANFSDMSSISVKPDKCAILQETVNQIRNIKQREGASHSSDPVQQGEVSSSKPTLITNEIFGPLLLDALEGFLFVVNAEGRVEHVTDNVVAYIKFTRDEVFGKSIYNFIHHGDHARFSALLPMSIAWTGDPTQTGAGGSKSRSFSLRFLVKSDDIDETIEEKQQRVCQYEGMHISSTQLRHVDDDPSEAGPRLLCVASRITYRDKVLNSALIEQFTTKLDTTGKIINIDVTSISDRYAQFLNKELTGSALQDICAPQDLHKFLKHLSDTLSAGQATSTIYRLRAGQDKYVQVQTKSKLFKPNLIAPNDIEFVMATHSIISDDSAGSSDPGGGTVNFIGGPLMTSIVNGTTSRNGAATMIAVSSGSDVSNAFPNNLLQGGGNSNSATYIGLDNESIFTDMFPTSTWDLETSWPETRPESRQSAVTTPVSTPTPRPPSASAFSPAGQIVPQSPLSHFTQPSPNPTLSNNNPLTYSPLTESGGSSFIDSIPDQKQDTKANIVEQEAPTDSTRLRDLLTKPPASADNGDSDNINKNTILKKLLNQPDEDETRSDNRTSPRVPHSPAIHNRSTMPGVSELPKTSTSSGGMLLQLLNEKNDDDDVEVKAGLKNGSELLQELLKEDEKPSQNQQSQSDTLLQSLGFPSPSPTNGNPGRTRKRPSDDTDDSNPTKVPSSGSKLCQKNKMLASLLAVAPSNHQPIPPIPDSVIKATPQEQLKIRPVSQPNSNNNNNNSASSNNMNQQPTPPQQNARRPPGRPPNTDYLNHHMLTPGIQRTSNRQFNHVDPTYSSPPTTTTSSSDMPWGEPGSDPILSSILDQVIDIVPEDASNQNDIQKLMDTMSSQSNVNNFPATEQMSETMAINIIQRSLMQCESAVKSPSSPTITLPGASAAFNTNTMANANHGYPPPPNYPRIGIPRPPLRPGTSSQYQHAANQHLRLQQQRKNAQDKRRLLERQCDQQFVIPSNAAVDAAGINNPGIQNIDNLLNNTVAPNVSLQRSSSMPESQLSPGFQVTQQNQRLTQNQQPYSPHSQLTSPIGQQAGFTQGNTGSFQQSGARMSPHPPFNQQLSPRQAYPQATAQNANWQQQTAGRLSAQQQQNPMLNAQLTGNYLSGPNNRGFPVQRNPPQQTRAVGSPGSGGTRHSPFPAETFQPPASPNSVYNNGQFMRLQRTNSAPTATTQLPGGLASPRQFGRDHPAPPHAYPSLPPNHPHHPMMYQQESSYPYDQTGLQLPYNGADRGRIPPHLQAGVSAGNTGTTSDYVRQELRAVVGARAGQQQQQMANTTRPTQLQQQQQMLNQSANTSDLVDSLALNFEMPPSSGASDSPKLWGAMGSDMGSMSPPQATTSRTTMEEVRQGDHNPSLLQKLLSE